MAVRDVSASILQGCGGSTFTEPVVKGKEAILTWRFQCCCPPPPSPSHSSTLEWGSSLPTPLSERLLAPAQNLGRDSAYHLLCAMPVLVSQEACYCPDCRDAMRRLLAGFLHGVGMGNCNLPGDLVLSAETAPSSFAQLLRGYFMSSVISLCFDSGGGQTNTREREREYHAANVADRFITLNRDPKLKENMVPKEAHTQSNI